MSTTPTFTSSDYDAIVIGGGPSGTTAATILAQHGHRVLVIERDLFPRFKIGESLIPATHDVLDRLGMLDALRGSQFPKKYSVQFISGSGRESAPFYFDEIDPSPRSQTWQVERSVFDQMMVDNARRHGVEVVHGASVKEVLFDDDDRARGVRIETCDSTQPGGIARRDLEARVVIDASGQRAHLARRKKLRRQDPRLRMAAIFTHFEGAERGEGRDEGATLIVHTEGQDGWFWYIPLSNNRVSVGVVGPIEHLIKGRQGDPQKVFDEELARCPGVAPRVGQARQMMPVSVLNDFSYTSEQIAGDGWVLVGDALGFLDPMYSTGVLLALKSGEMAGDAVAAALADDELTAERLGAFGPQLRAGMTSFRQLIYAFYDKRFSFARFLEHHPEHRSGVIDILVGDVFDRSFDTMFADMERMLPGFGPGAPADAPPVAVATAG